MDEPPDPIEDSSPMNDSEEQRVIHNAVNSFHRYRDQAHFHITHKRRQQFYAMPYKHWSMLSKPPFNVLGSFDRVDEAIEANSAIAKAFVQSGIAMYDLQQPGVGDSKAEWQGAVNPNDQEKAHSTIKQLYRDWSAEGAEERKQCFQPVIEALDAEYEQIPRAKRGAIKVLVPGAGLGRSMFEIVRAGYCAEGNEISYHQLIGSNFMLNYTHHANQFALYPWIHGFSNHASREDQLQKVMLPDVHPGTEMQSVAAESEVHPFERMSFSSADFCVAYKEEDALESFDAVASIFFIDTAPNVIKYVEAVHHCLKTGGIWINLGPLKWHFENSPPGGNDKDQSSKKTSTGIEDAGIGDPGSVELTEEEVVALVEHMGFKVEKHDVLERATGYIQNPRSMWQGIYRPSFWVARKMPSTGDRR